jgi:hypothetical protein
MDNSITNQSRYDHHQSCNPLIPLPIPIREKENTNKNDSPLAVACLTSQGEKEIEQSDPGVSVWKNFSWRGEWGTHFSTHLSPHYIYIISQ